MVQEEAICNVVQQQRVRVHVDVFFLLRGPVVNYLDELITGRVQWRRVGV